MIWTRELVCAALANPPPQQLPLEGDRASAVLLPLLARPDGATLLMVRKSQRLAKHAGQVGFPGGALDAGETAQAAALREAFEEVALSPDCVELLGQLDDERTWVTNFHIRPLVGWVQAIPATWQLNAYEIDGVLEVGVQELVETEPCSVLEFAAYGQAFAMPRWEFSGGRVIWGASGRNSQQF